MSLTLVKVGYLLIKSAARPISSVIKRFAVRRTFFRRACILAAQRFHRMEIKMRQTLLSNHRHMHVKPLEEAKAIEMGGKMGF